MAMLRGMSGRVRALFLVLLQVVLLLVASACNRATVSPPTGEAPSTPTLVVRDDSENLLLTWLDDVGNFHVERRVKDVPAPSRELVRIVDPDKEEGAHGDRIVVADLRAPRPDGTYAVRSMGRTEFDDLAEGRRAKRAPTLANKPPPAASASGTPEAPAAPGAAGAGATAGAVAAGKPMVIVYGASWCGACHEATRWLKGRGIAYVEKDIEADAQADREMRAKLSKAGLRGGSIPVIDVGGVVLMGFDPREVQRALGRNM